MSSVYNVWENMNKSHNMKKDLYEYRAKNTLVALLPKEFAGLDMRNITIVEMLKLTLA